MSTDPLFTPLRLGHYQVSNRIVMPPMTRSRASQPGDVANGLMAEYYAQRASAGLIISEGTQISPLGKGYAWTPGIYSAEQIAGWRQVTDAVHAQGGLIFAQLWHVGRITHPANTGGQQPVSSSAIAAKGVRVFIDDGQGAPGFVESVTPRALSQAGQGVAGVEFPGTHRPGRTLHQRDLATLCQSRAHAGSGAGRQ